MAEWVSAVGTIIIAVVGGVLSMRLRKDDNERAETEKSERSAQEQVRRDREEREEKRREYELLDRALSLHGELTSREVIELRDRVDADAPAEGSVDRRLIKALHERSAAQVQALGALIESQAKPEMLEPLRRETEEIRKRADPAEQSSASKVLDDSWARFAWAEDQGQLSKHQALQRIALHMQASLGKPSYDALVTALSREVDAAPTMSKVTSSRPLLVPVSSADNAHRRVAEQIGPLVLDGTDYVVDHRVGRAGEQYGARTQMPVIEHFAAKPGYPIYRV